MLVHTQGTCLAQYSVLTMANRMPPLEAHDKGMSAEAFFHSCSPTTDVSENTLHDMGGIVTVAIDSFNLQ